MTNTNPDLNIIDTIAGPFDRARTEELRKLIEAKKKAGTHRHAPIKFEEKHIVFGFGMYLLEFLDSVWEDRK